MSAGSSTRARRSSSSRGTRRRRVAPVRVGRSWSGRWRRASRRRRPPRRSSSRAARRWPGCARRPAPPGSTRRASRRRSWPPWTAGAPTRPARGAVALAERPRAVAHLPADVTTGPVHRPRHAAAGPADGETGDPARELATLLDGGSTADLRGREEALRAERDERLAQAWAADLAACEARQRRDELAGAAGVDPVRAGDRSFVTALLEVAQAEVRRARGALEERPAAAPAARRRARCGPRGRGGRVGGGASCAGSSSCAAPPRSPAGSSPGPRNRRTGTSRPCWPRRCAAGSRA